jgi:hypothetical protein
MENNRLIIRGRIEEVSTIVQFTIDALNLNLTDFSAYKPSKYTPNFIADLTTGLTAVNNIVNPVILTAELKKITFKLISSVIGLRITMNLLEGYLEDAAELTVGIDDFGLKKVRQKISSGDVEGLYDALKVVLLNIESNIGKLTDVGYTAAMKTALQTTMEDIAKDNADQNAKLEARSELVKKNFGIINEFLTKIKGIWSDGKKLYSLTDKERAKYFTNADILRRIRNDELHTTITGTVMDKNGVLANGAKIVARPSTEGKRGKTVKSSPDGKYELKGLRPVNYILTVTLKNGGVFMANVDAVTNEAVVLNLKETA